jgi:TolB-like protein
MRISGLKKAVFILVSCLAIPALADNPTINQLEAALQVNPDNYALHYYLGVLQQREGNRAEAIRQWDTYVKRAPFNRRVVTVKEQLTILRQQEARDAASRATSSGAGDAEAGTIAVLEFRNPGKPTLKPLAKGLNAMIITDLSKVSQLKVVERTQIQALMQEMQLAQQGVVDASTSGQVGRLLAAESIDWGTVDLRGNELIINNILSETASASVVGETSRSGPQETFFDLQKQVVFDILAQLGINREDLDEETLAAIEKVQTRNFQAFLAFGQGLVFLDEGNFEAADDSFSEATAIDPEFDLAAEAAESTPSTDTTEVVEQAMGYDWEDDTEEAEETEDEVVEEETVAVETVIEEEETSVGSDVATISEDTSNVAVDDTVVITETEFSTPGPSFSDDNDGYIINQLVNGQGEYHGTYKNASLQNLSNWELTTNLTSVHPAYLRGSQNVVNSLSISDSFPDNPITGGLPNDVIQSDLGFSDYLAWGTWTDSDTMFREPSTGVPAAALEYTFAHTGFWIAGLAMTPQQIASLNSQDTEVFYGGDAYGVHFAEPGTLMQGYFMATVDAVALEITSLDIDIASANHSLTLQGGSAAYNVSEGYAYVGNGTWMQDGQTIDPGYAIVTFYGPEGEEIGGIFETNGFANGASQIHGMFAGHEEIVQPPTDPPTPPAPTGPTNQDGYFTNQLINDLGDFHGVFTTEGLQDLNSWFAFGSAFSPAEASGTFESIDSLTIGAFTDQVDTGLPNAVDWTTGTYGMTDYMAWGDWSDTDQMSRSATVQPDAQNYLFSHTGFFLYGDITTQTDFSTLASTDTAALYSGDAWGVHFAEPNVVMTGTFNATMDFVNFGITDFDLSVSSANHSFQIDSMLGAYDETAGYAFLGDPSAITIDGTDASSALITDVYVTLFGPTASEMGGVFAVDVDNTGNAVHGMFQGIAN